MHKNAEFDYKFWNSFSIHTNKQVSWILVELTRIRVELTRIRVELTQVRAELTRIRVDFAWVRIQPAIKKNRIRVPNLSGAFFVEWLINPNPTGWGLI